VWIESVAKFYYPHDIEMHLLNYAFGGAGVSDGAEDDADDDVLFTLHREVDSYLLAHHDKADENSLFVVWMGANNYIAIPDDPQKAILDTNKGIQEELVRLAKKGAKHVVVMTIPDLGRTPAATDFDLVDFLSDLTNQHNSLLKENVTKLSVQYPDVQWVFFDVNQIFVNALTSPEMYGFHNVTETCYEAVMETPSTSLSVLKMAASVKEKSSVEHACDGYLFFDPIHPTTAAHEFIAREAIALLEQEHLVFE
jgi:phospholipase/lecithinase/hemolysin